MLKTMSYCPHCGTKIKKESIKKEAAPKKIKTQLKVLAILVDAVIKAPSLSGRPKLPTRLDWIYKKRIIVIQSPGKLSPAERQMILNDLGVIAGVRGVYWVGTMPWIKFLDKGWSCFIDPYQMQWVMWPSNKSRRSGVTKNTQRWPRA